MAGVVLDTCVVIALFNRDDKHHKASVAALLSHGGGFRISTLTVAEALVRAIADSDKQAERVLADLSENFGPFYPLDTQVALEAALVRSHSRLKLPDAIISATASVHGVPLWTCDGALAKAHKGARLIA